MTLFSVVLFIHVMSAVALFVAFAFEGAILVRLRSARNLDELGQSLKNSRRLGSIYGPSFLGILLGGIYMAAQLHLRAAWIPLALGSTLLLGMVAGTVTGSKMSRLRKALLNKESSFDSLSALARANALLISYGFRTGLAVGIVFLMSATPPLVPSLVALIVGSIAGIIVALQLRRVSTKSAERSVTAGARD